MSSVLPLVGHSQITLPASGNLTAADGSKVTGVLVQAPGDAIEDGHEVVFQTDGPKHQYQCFLASTLSGVATVPLPASVDALPRDVSDELAALKSPCGERTPM